MMDYNSALCSTLTQRMRESWDVKGKLEHPSREKANLLHASEGQQDIALANQSKVGSAKS